MKVEFLAAAESDLGRAFAYYNEQSEGWGLSSPLKSAIPLQE
jgi:hypothetical protein